MLTRLMMSLGHVGMVKGRADVLPIAFHVTYWDQLDWKDSFSLAEATDRQDRYGHRFGNGSYTPEMVIDGATSHVGSDRSAVGPAIERAKRSSETAASVRVSKDGSDLVIEVGGGKGSGKLLLVGFDHDHETAIRRGENGGRTLQELNVVRSIRAIGTGKARRCGSARNSRKARMSRSSSKHRTAALSAPRNSAAEKRAGTRSGS